MAVMRVGGRRLELDHETVVRRMRDEYPEDVREHVVEVADRLFPPKQVLAVVTGWPRTSFTTMEAQRVLTKVGFVCRRARREQPSGGFNGAPPSPDSAGAPADSSGVSLGARLAVLEEAVAGIIERVRALESTAKHRA